MSTGNDDLVTTLLSRIDALEAKLDDINESIFRVSYHVQGLHNKAPAVEVPPTVGIPQYSQDVPVGSPRRRYFSR